ncbi:MAG: NADP-specific glutamate dehydrogenase [Chitinophagaceae bacterium]
MKAEHVLNDLKEKHPGESEFLQAASEILHSIEEEYNKHPEFEQAKIIERLVEPDRIFTFKVFWVDDKGEIQVNIGYRVQFNNAIGPYKGGLRFHKSVNLSILKFLGFEQVFKNALTTLPMGGAKGGSNFNPQGKSDNEVMRFCQSFMLELWRHIGPVTDIPAGDIGVGSREIGYLYGMYKKLALENTGVLTGKGLSYGGSLIRPEATGYGNLYFLMEMLKEKGIQNLVGKTCLVSGSGNVAQYTVQKINELGGKAVTLSDSNGYIYDPEGITAEKLAFVFELKNKRRSRIEEYAKHYGVKYVEGKKPWLEKGDIALPSATQNEIDKQDAELLIKNGCIAVSEGANMPSTQEAIKVYKQHKIMYGPGKAANAGGVATSGLEMAQNAMHLCWSREEVDTRLQKIIKDIHTSCVKYGKISSGYIDYEKGANIAGFMKVADAMIAHGIM